jgi:hypothetical protein
MAMRPYILLIRYRRIRAGACGRHLRVGAFTGCGKTRLACHPEEFGSDRDAATWSAKLMDTQDGLNRI